ncbi:HU family DNA-binding protein [Mycoplasmoides alvi]|uniref:HU family DNA-binding protein n=1 Tax=Mycoplasmoides alvi TaxID=78580 RepID=UPI00146FAFB8|nr:HU family DNA-binding protein [Mycoplasmoides alvi]
MSSSSTKKLLTQSEMIKEISESTGVPLVKVKEIIASMQNIIKSELIKNELVRFFNIGKFKVVSTKARTGINPFTKEKIKIPARKKVRFLVAKSYSSSILENKGEKKTVSSSTKSKNKSLPKKTLSKSKSKKK